MSKQHEPLMTTEFIDNFEASKTYEEQIKEHINKVFESYKLKESHYESKL